MWLHRHRSVARRPGLNLSRGQEAIVDRRHRRSQAGTRRGAHRRARSADRDVQVANRPAGYRQLIDWLVDHQAADAVIGVESPGSYGRCLVTALAGAGFEVLHVPGWRTHRERHRRGPGKTDPGDALSIAMVVLEQARRARSGRGARDRPGAGHAGAATPPVCPRPHPSHPAAACGLAAARSCRRGRRGPLRSNASWPSSSASTSATASPSGSRLAASESSPQTSTTSTSASPRSTREIAELLTDHGNPLEDLKGAGTNLTATIIAQAGDVRRFRNASAFARFCGAAPIPTRIRTNQRPAPAAPRRQPPTQRRALPHRDRPTTPPPRRQDLSRQKDRRRQNPARSPPRPQTPPRQRPLPPAARWAESGSQQHPSHQKPLDIGESNGSSAPCSVAGPTARSTAQARTHRRSRRLARLLQSPPTTRRPQPQATHRPPQRAEQPPRVLRLGIPGSHGAWVCDRFAREAVMFCSHQRRACAATVRQLGREILCSDVAALDLNGSRGSVILRRRWAPRRPAHRPPSSRPRRGRSSGRCCRSGSSSPSPKPHVPGRLPGPALATRSQRRTVLSRRARRGCVIRPSRPALPA